MGRVFTYEELSTHQVPDESTFSIAREAFSAEVEGAVKGGLIHGAMIFGSAAMKRTNARSDLDCLIVLTAHEDPNWQAAADIVERTKQASGRLFQ